MKSSFVNGPISPTFLAEKIAAHQHKTEIGAHTLFLGQVRADKVDDNEVVAIEYSAYEEMADKELYEIKERVFETYPITCMHIYHSLGLVKKGEICLFVFISAPRRKVVFDAQEFAIETIKNEAPIFGKEIYTDQNHTWKINSK